MVSKLTERWPVVPVLVAALVDSGKDGRVWALRTNMTSYDAWYVALAEALGCRLVTLDRKLGRADGPTCEIVLPSIV